MVFHPILYYLSPKISIFQKPLIVETWNLHHWIWHASNPKYITLKQIWCIFPSQNEQNMKFLAVCLTPPDKNEKKVNLYSEKGVQKGLNISTYRCSGMLITMNCVRTLCDKYFLSCDGFSWFVTGRSRYRVLKHGVGVQWEPRSTAA